MVCHLGASVSLEGLAVQGEQVGIITAARGYPATVVLRGFRMGHPVSWLVWPESANAVVIVISLVHAHGMRRPDASTWGFLSPRVEGDHDGIAAAVATAGAACLRGFGVAAGHTALDGPERGRGGQRGAGKAPPCEFFAKDGGAFEISSLTGAGGTTERFEQVRSAVGHSAVGGGGVGGGGGGEAPAQVFQAHFFAPFLYSGILSTGNGGGGASATTWAAGRVLLKESASHQPPAATGERVGAVDGAGVVRAGEASRVGRARRER